MPNPVTPVPVASSCCRSLTLLASALLLLATLPSPLWAQGNETNFGRVNGVPTSPPANVPAPPPPAMPPPPAPPVAPVAPGPDTVPKAPAPGGAAASPGNQPEVIYEGQPAPPQQISKRGGALPAGGGQSLPTQAGEGPRATIGAAQVDIDKVFDQIRQQTGVTVKAMGLTRGQKLDLRVREIPVEDILNQIATPRQWIWIQRPDGTYEVYDKDTYVKQVQSNQVIRQVFQLHYIDAEDLQKIIQPILTPEIGAVAADARSNKLIVTDLPSKVALVQGIIQEYDVQLYTRVFQIHNAKTEDLGDKLDEIKSKSGEIQIDPANHVIIVRDTFDKIKAMEQLVEILDRDQEMRVYNLNNIGLDGQIAEDFVEKFIKPIATEGDNAVLEYNKETAKLLVRDVHSVQEKIVQILREVDVPRKQVLIEGEIVSVGLDHTFSLGTQWTVSGNLNKAVAAGQPGTTPFNTTTSGTVSTNFKNGLPLATIGSAGLNVFSMNDAIKAQLTAALTDTRSRILLQPRLLIANNEEGNIEVTNNQPIAQTFFNNSTNANQQFQSSGQSTVSTGLKLKIIPHISNRGLVELEVRFENSTPIIVENITPGVRGVGSNEQSAETMLIVPSGQTRVIGGLIRHDRSESDSGVPLLSRIPYLGFLFGAKTKSNNLSNLMFFVTPTIINEQPLNDLIDEPVNDVARQAMAEAKREPATPGRVNEIPPEMVPFLEQIRPEPLPMPDSESLPTTGTTSSLLGVELTTGTLALDQLSSAAGLLHNERYNAKSVAVPIKIGGAVQSLTGGAQGPTGVFGATAATKGGGKGKTAAHAGTRTTKPVVAGKAPTTRTPTKGRSSSTNRHGSDTGRSSRTGNGATTQNPQTQTSPLPQSSPTQ